MRPRVVSQGSEEEFLLLQASHYDWSLTSKTTTLLRADGLRSLVAKRGEFWLVFLDDHIWLPVTRADLIKMSRELEEKISA